MANDEHGNGHGGNMAGLPHWAQAVLKIGVLPSIAAGLVWWLATSVDRQLVAQTQATNAMVQNVIMLTQAINAHREDAQREAEAGRYTREQLVQLQRQMCLNTAKSEDARAACWKP